MCRLPRYLFPSIILAMSLPIGTLPRPPEQPEEDQEGEQEARFCRTGPTETPPLGVTRGNRCRDYDVSGDRHPPSLHHNGTWSRGDGGRGVSGDQFVVIGHAGGNPKAHCENTLAATASGLAEGANAIEIDLSISRDGVVFLWHDPEPYSVTAILRRFGVALPGRCMPVISGATGFRAANAIDFSEISDHWFYYDSQERRKMPEKIPTLRQWLERFGADPRIEVIWLDVKIESEFDLPRFVNETKRLLLSHGLIGGDSPRAKIIMSTGANDRNAEVLGSLLDDAGLDGRKVTSDTVSLSPWVFDGDGHDGVSKSLDLCQCCANLGLPVVAANSWEAMKAIVRRNVSARQAAGRRVEIFVWTVDDEIQMEWLVKSGVDGVITNNPGLLRYVAQRFST